MGERGKPGFHMDFDYSMRVEFHGATVIPDTGLLAYRELDDALGLTK
jgi:hypothetical protein